MATIDPMRVGLAGAGCVAGCHLEAHRRLTSQVKVVAIADPARLRAHARADAFEIGEVFGSISEMIAQGDLEALDVATPRENHIAATAQGTAAGLPVQCQKPFAPNFHSAEASFRSHRDTRVMVHDNYRFRPHYRTIKSWLGDGLIGTVRSARCVQWRPVLSPTPGASTRPWSASRCLPGWSGCCW